jgi:hypothetical protein
MRIDPSSVRSYDVVNGIIEIPLNQNFSHHSISIEGDTGSVTLEQLPTGLTQYREFDNNILSQGSSAVFVLGSTEAMRFTPTETANGYIISVSSF